MDTTLSLASVLTKAHDSLTYGNWRQGSWFWCKNNTICVCAHGAVQALVNPTVRRNLNSTNMGKGISPNASFAANIGKTASKDKTIFDAWNNRPLSIKHNEFNHMGSQEAHYLMGMVGLTVDFNDDPDTTLEMVKTKFQEAITIAKQLGI